MTVYSNKLSVYVQSLTDQSGNLGSSQNITGSKTIYLPISILVL
jgi:hypothetical protein